MATSEKGHYVRLDEALVEAQDFVDAGIHRRAISNLDHLADQYAQALIKWVAPSTFPLGFQPFGEDPEPEELDHDVFHRIWTSWAFDLPVRKSTGEAYRCRLRARIKAGPTAGTSDFATFRFVLAPFGFSESELFTTGANVKEMSIFGGTAAQWQGTNDGSLIYLDASLTARARATVASLNTIGGNQIDAVWLRAQLVCFSMASAVTVYPELTGVDLSAYLHP